MTFGSHLSLHENINEINKNKIKNVKKYLPYVFQEEREHGRSLSRCLNEPLPHSWMCLHGQIRE